LCWIPTFLRQIGLAGWANNNAGWQWSAGSGCDAQPYFRVFNPVIQGRKFDPDGAYVRRWVPQLARLETRYVHAPWQAPAESLEGAGVDLGRDYPTPIVEHRTGRERFLAVASRHVAKHKRRS
jgi:deoxyribodipyrimidine photo-lyase